MDVEKLSLEQIPANRQLVDELYAQQQISLTQRNQALDYLYPSNQWGQWTALLFMAFGVALLLSGIIFFFAFNWAAMPLFIKFAVIQVSIATCLVGAYFCTLKRLSGKLLLLCGSVLVGVFLAVFGQTYQTGANSYELFMYWALLILLWTLLANFLAQWLVWLTIANTALLLWWRQLGAPSEDMAPLIYPLLGLFNLGFLLLAEYLSNKPSYHWLQQQWAKLTVLSIILLTMSFYSIMPWLFEDRAVSNGLTYGFILGMLGHLFLFAFYRFKKASNIYALTLVTLSCCIIIEAVFLRLFTKNELFFDSVATFVGILFIMAMITVSVFSAAVIYLRKVAKQWQEQNA